MKNLNWIEIPKDKLFCIRLPIIKQNSFLLAPMKEKSSFWLYVLFSWFMFLWGFYEYDFQFPQLRDGPPQDLGTELYILTLVCTIHICRVLATFWVAHRLELSTSTLSLQLNYLIPTLHFDICDIHRAHKEQFLYTYFAGFSTVVLATGICYLTCSPTASLSVTWSLSH